MERMTELAMDRSSRSGSSDPLVEGFRAVYEAEVARLVRLAHLITGSNAAAEDPVHDAFLAAFDRWDRIDDPQGYMYRAVVNRSRSLLRRRRNELTRRPESPSVALPPEIDEMWTALARLTPRRRTALVLRYYADLPIDEIADLMNARPGTVRSLIHRGHESLRKVLES
jgi:RNA polymerase sigma factor (sigma-70 family)